VIRKRRQAGAHSKRFATCGCGSAGGYRILLFRRKFGKMITIDGSEGQGRGQILRTSLALSLVIG
jgi:hypothetical protein